MESEEQVRHQGEVIWFAKNYGFLSWSIDNVKQKDLFVYFSDIEGDGYKKLVKGQSVSFAVGKNHHGVDKAIEVIIKY